MVTFCISLCFQLREAVSEVTAVMGKFRKILLKMDILKFCLLLKCETI